MKKFFGLLTLTLILTIGCAEGVSAENFLQIVKNGSANIPRERQILSLSFTRGGGVSVSTSGASSMVSGGQAQISFNMPAGFYLRGDFDISGQIYAQISGGNGIFSETWSGSNSKAFDLAQGSCSISISDLKAASGRIILRLIPRN